MYQYIFALVLVAYAELVKVKDLFEFVFYSKYVNEVLLYEWLLRIDSTNIFLEFEIHRNVDSQMIRSLKKTVRCLEDRPIFPTWIRVVAKGKCLLDDDIDELFHKIFGDSFIKNLLVREYLDARRVVYKTNLSMDDENFRELLTTQMTNFELKLLKKRYLKQTFDAYCRDPEVPDEKVNHEYMSNLAKSNNFIGCHWLIMYAKDPSCNASEEVIDWKKLLKSFFVGFLNQQPNAIAIGSKKLSEGGMCLSVYHKNFFNRDSTFALEKAIRESGVLRLIKLKMDIYSVCQIRHGNQYGLRPTIFCSIYNNRICKSMIDNDYTLNYKPDVKFPKDQVYFNHYKKK